MYYKVLNDKMMHNNHQYKLGLNEDTIPFNPTGSCQPGGLYYTDKNNLYKFLDFGTKIASISIPEDAKIYLDPDGNKWKADKLIINSIVEMQDHPIWSEEDFCWNVLKEYGLKYIKYVSNEKAVLRYMRAASNYSDTNNILQYVPENKQTEEICIEAIRQNPLNLEFVFKPTAYMCQLSIQMLRSKISYLDMSNRRVFLEPPKPLEDTTNYYRPSFLYYPGNLGVTVNYDLYRSSFSK